MFCVGCSLFVVCCLLSFLLIVVRCSLFVVRRLPFVVVWCLVFGVCFVCLFFFSRCVVFCCLLVVGD